MAKYKVRLNNQAFRDIDSFFEYIALEKLAPENAKGQTDRIQKLLKTLDSFLHSQQLRTDIGDSHLLEHVP